MLEHFFEAVSIALPPTSHRGGWYPPIGARPVDPRNARQNQNVHRGGRFLKHFLETAGVSLPTGYRGSPCLLFGSPRAAYRGRPLPLTRIAGSDGVRVAPFTEHHVAPWTEHLPR